MMNMNYDFEFWYTIFSSFCIVKFQTKRSIFSLRILHKYHRFIRRTMLQRSGLQPGNLSGHQKCKDSAKHDIYSKIYFNVRKYAISFNLTLFSCDDQIFCLTSLAVDQFERREQMEFPEMDPFVAQMEMFTCLNVIWRKELVGEYIARCFMSYFHSISVWKSSETKHRLPFYLQTRSCSCWPKTL